MDLSQSLGSNEVLGQGVVWHGDSEKLSMDDGFELVGGRVSEGFNIPDGAGGSENKELDPLLGRASAPIEDQCFQQPVKPVRFRVLFLGSTGSDRHKTMVLKKLAEALASRLPQRKQQPVIINNFHEKIHNIVFLDAFESTPVEMYEDAGLHVIEADFLGLTKMDRVRDYLHTIRQNNERIDIAVYFFTQHKSRDQAHADMRLLQRLEDFSVPVLPLLVLPHERPPSASGSRNLRSPSFVRPQAQSSSFVGTSTKIDLTRSLSDYLDQYKIKTIDLAGINPETPNFMQQEQHQAVIALTVDQFIAICSEDIARILQKCVTPTSSPAKAGPSTLQQWLAVAATAEIQIMAILGMTLIALVIGSLAMTKLLRSSPPASEHVATMALEPEPAHMRLNPMWDVVDDETLRHLFMVELSNPAGDWTEKTLVVVLETNRLMEKEFNMVYEPNSRFNYVVDVPSPCLIHSDDDIVAKVLWRYKEDARTKVEKLVDQVVLSRETCQPAYDRWGISRECRPQNELTIVKRLHPRIPWKLLFDEFKTQSKKITETMITAYQALLRKLLK